jgi:hypothetical protein
MGHQDRWLGIQDPDVQAWGRSCFPAIEVGLGCCREEGHTQKELGFSFFLLKKRKGEKK